MFDATGRSCLHRGEPGLTTAACPPPGALELDGGCDNGDGGSAGGAAAPRVRWPGLDAAVFKMAAAEAGLASGLGLRLDESEGDRRRVAGVM